MKNELKILRRNEKFSPNLRVYFQEQRNYGKNEEFRQREPKVANPNAITLEEIFEDEIVYNVNKEVDFIQEEILNLYRRMKESHPCIYLARMKKLIYHKTMLYKHEHK